jgi:YtoQ family protein
MPRQWKVYFSGEIHSDDCGVNILGPEDKPFWKDHKGAQLNAIRTRTLIAAADVVVVRFGEQYRQWNAAFDAGLASAQGKPLIVLHPEEFTHALKEVDAAALAVAREPGQVVDILQYVIAG